MIEIPEAVTWAEQLTGVVAGKVTEEIVINASPHKFAFWGPAAEKFSGLLKNTEIRGAAAIGGHLVLEGGFGRLAMADGVNLRYLPAGEKRPAKHQLLIVFRSGDALVSSVQMYGFYNLIPPGGEPGDYLRTAESKPSPLSPDFTRNYFDGLFAGLKPKLKVKAALATEQRIPGFGNGVLQDVLFNARIHPKSELAALDGDDWSRLYGSVRNTLAGMAGAGGRDTEKDIYGQPGGYRTLMSAGRYPGSCPACGTDIMREAFLGGKVYYCPVCQTRKVWDQEKRSGV